MTNQLAIGYLAGPRRNLPGARSPASFATPSGRDSLSTRPAIPHAVITWCDDEATPPVGAGDPASAIAGPPRFTVLRDRVHRLARGRRPTLDAVLFSVLVATLAGLASAVVFHSGARSNAWVSYDTVAAMPSASIHVEVKGVRSLESPASSLLTAKGNDATAAN